MTVAHDLTVLRGGRLDPGVAADGVTLLSIYLFMLMAIPSQFVIGALGGAGSPALLVGVGCLLWWVFARFAASRQSQFVATGPGIRAAAGWLAAAVLLSYAAATLRPAEAAERSTSSLALISLAGWLGVLLLAHDGIVSPSRLLRYFGRLSLAGTGMALLGLVQFATHQPWVDHISIPGLSVNNVIYGAQSREGFTRPSGTAVHPIEFGAVLTMLLPIALARAATPAGSHPPSGHSLVRWAPPFLIMLAIALSNSRSAFVSAAVGVLLLLPALPARLRRGTAAGMLTLAALIFVTVPGMLGTVLGLFAGIGTDSSARSRFESYDVAMQYLAQSPAFGRGLGTFLPRYRIFDNEYLLLLLELGVVGLAALLYLIGATVITASAVRRHSPDPALGLAGQGIAAAVGSGAVSLALFDAFSFPMVPGLLFLLMGLGGGARSLAIAVGQTPGRLKDGANQWAAHR